MNPVPTRDPVFRTFARALAALLFVLTACDSPVAPPAREITSMHMSGVYADGARLLAAEFERETGIHVRILSAPYLALREKQLTALLNGSRQFDVLQIAQQWTGEFAPYLWPLDELIARYRLDLHGFVQPATRHDGIRCLPLACDAITLLYRKDLFAAKAAEFQRLSGRPLQPPTTWDEYLELARFFHNEPLYGNIVMGLKEQNFTVWAGIFHGLGGRLVDAHWRPSLNSEVGVRSLSLFTEMFRYAPPGSQRLGPEEANALFLQGKGALYLTWPSLIWSQMNDTNLCRISGQIGAAVIPGARPQISSWSLGLNPASTNKDAAFRWIRFLISERNSQRLLLQNGKGSPLVSTYQDEAVRQAVFYLPMVFEGLKTGEPRFTIAPSQLLCDYLDYQISETVSGRVSPRLALDRSAEHWRRILEKAGYLRPAAEPSTP